MQQSFLKHRTIGLLGGSFNPAHGGHLYISLYALKKLGLDEIWWLVSPKNPLKSEKGLASYKERLASAKAVAARYKHIRVLDLEAQHKLRYTYQTVAFVKRRYPAAHFVWMMGADNLNQFHRWKRWQWILTQLPILVFDRAPYSHKSLRSKTYLRMRRFLLKSMGLDSWKTAPMLAFIHLKRDPMSSTFLRKTLGKAAFLRHNKRVGNR